MNKQIEDIKKVRASLIDLVNMIPDDKLNEIPAGFNNNITWNLGHLIAAQQGVCYVRAGIAPVIDEQYITPYKSGTKPEKYIDSNEIARIKSDLLSSLDKLIEDYKNNVFSAYNAWTTRYGVELTSIDEAISFLGFHEGLHMGYVMALKRVIGSK